MNDAQYQRVLRDVLGGTDDTEAELIEARRIIASLEREAAALRRCIASLESIVHSLGGPLPRPAHRGDQL